MNAPVPPDGQVPPPWQSAAPFIPAAVDPEIAAARAKLAASPRTAGSVHGMRPSLRRRLVSGALDGLVIFAVGGFVAALSPASADDPPVTLPLIIAWLLVRPLPLVALGATPGHVALRYRVVGANGGRVGAFAAVVRDVAACTLLYNAVRIAFAYVFSGSGVSRIREDDHRYPHDVLSNTWPVGRSVD